MRAARFYGDREALAVEDVEKPKLGSNDVLVDLRAASLCGSDLGYVNGEREPGVTPITLGHEGAGIVSETGADVSGVEEGDRVAIHYILSCGRCEPCLEGFDNRCRDRRSIGHHVDGTFAESIAVPARSVRKLPPSISFDEGSIIGCAVSTAYHAITRADLSGGDVVVVFGAGGVGLHAVLWADALNAGTVVAVDPKEEQLDAAIEYGADQILNPENTDVVGEISNMTGGRGADVAVECSGSPVAMTQSIDAVGSDNKYESGTVVSVGIQSEPIDVGYFDLREGQLLLSGDHTLSELSEIISMLDQEAVDLSPTVSHRFDLEEINDAISLMNDSSDFVGRIILSIG